MSQSAVLWLVPRKADASEPMLVATLVQNRLSAELQGRTPVAVQSPRLVEAATTHRGDEVASPLRRNEQTRAEPLRRLANYRRGVPCAAELLLSGVMVQAARAPQIQGAHSTDVGEGVELSHRRDAPTGPSYHARVT